MSVIAVQKVVSKGKKKVVFASDTQTTWGYNKTPKVENKTAGVSTYGKVFTTNGMTIGCAGATSDISMFQLYARTHKPKGANKDDVLDWFIEFCDWVKKKSGGNFGDVCIHSIIEYKGKVFSVYDWMEVHEVEDFWAVGSGMWIAIGAMEVGATAEHAVKSAMKYDLFCGGRVKTLSIDI